MKKRFIIAVLFLVLLSTYKPKSFSLINIFDVKKIVVENNFLLKDKFIKKKLFFLYDKNLVFLKKNDIKKILSTIDFIESVEIKKIYPDKIIIKIFEEIPILVLQNRKKKFYLNKNIELINYADLENFKNLPIVFGDKENFKIFYANLKKIDFPLEIITRYYLFESKRWDLEIDQKKIIKLPVENYVKSLKNFMSFRKQVNYNKYKIFDYRINNQLILK